MKVGIIGFGRFGRFMSKHMKNKFEVLVTDSQDKGKEANEEGVKFVSIEEIVNCKIIILAVPMENLEEQIKNIKDKVKVGTIIIDVCSLKIFSCNLMKDLLPESVEIIGTHPLFGPQSAPNSIKGMRIALCNITAKEDTFNKVREFCESLELKVIITTPEEHDKQMSRSQALTHFIGKAINDSGISRVEMSTKTFDDLMNIADIIKNDTKALFENMQTFNPYSKEDRKNFINNCKKIDAQFD